MRVGDLVRFDGQPHHRMRDGATTVVRATGWGVRGDSVLVWPAVDGKSVWLLENELTVIEPVAEETAGIYRPEGARA